MRKMSLKELHECEIQILDKVHSFCLANGIKYSLGAGTLLGAVRHKGFIPWDDDIDIYMMRQEYDRFHDLVFKNPIEGLELHSERTCKDCFFPFIKMVDPRTRVHCHWMPEDGSMDLNVNIDVFPMDDVPRHGFACALLYWIRRLNDYVLTAAKNKVLPHTSRIVNFRHPLTILLALMGRILPYRWPMRVQRRLMRLRHRGSRRVYSSINVDFDVTNVRKEVFDSFIDMPFEGKNYRVVSRYNELLCAAYGDYMTLPPKEKQVLTHNFEAFWRD